MNLRVPNHQSFLQKAHARLRNSSQSFKLKLPYLFGISAIVSGALVLAEEDSPPPENGQVIESGEREILKVAVIQKEDHSIIIRQATPPQAVQPTPSPASAPKSQMTDEESVEKRNLMITVTCLENRASLIEWSRGTEKFSAWSPINFEHLSGQLHYEARGIKFTLMNLVTKRPIPDRPHTELSERERLYTSAPTNSSLTTQPILVNGSQENSEAMDFLFGLHEYYFANRDLLANKFDERQRERELRKSMPIPSKPKEDATVTYWKYYNSKANSSK